MLPSVHIIPLLASLFVLQAAQSRAETVASLSGFNLPWSTSGSSVVDASGNNITLAGVNWSGSLELMLPEGLQYRSAGDIVDMIKSLGANAVRHTFAIEMLDDIIDGGKDVSIFDSAIKALGKENGTAVAQKIVANNKQYGWTFNTTRLQVLATIQQLEESAGILMHLDNHISKAMWCCSARDGNGFFGATYFDVDKWKRGLAYMAQWARGRGNIASIAMRNELRRTAQANAQYPYGWDTWTKAMTAAADGIYAANPDLLILFSGLDSDTQLTDVITGKTQFDPTAYAYSNKLVFELHRYERQTCDSTACSLYYSGFSATGMPQPKLCNGKCPTAKYRAPVWLTEAGADVQSGKAADLLGCIKTVSLLGDGTRPFTWFLWALQGGYYTREGKQDFEETWSLLNHHWTDWRRADFVNNFYKDWVIKTNPTQFSSQALP